MYTPDWTYTADRLRAGAYRPELEETVHEAMYQVDQLIRKQYAPLYNALHALVEGDPREHYLRNQLAFLEAQQTHLHKYLPQPRLPNGVGVTELTHAGCHDCEVALRHAVALLVDNATDTASYTRTTPYGDHTARLVGSAQL